MNKELTEKQQKFLDVLFEEARGNFAVAKSLAGYSDDYSVSRVVNSLQDELLELTKKFIATRGARAAWAMMEVLDNPTDLGNKEKMAAAKDFLDRAGHKASDKLEVKTETPLFILPEKHND